MIEVNTEKNTKTEIECDNHRSIWFPIHTYFDLNIDNYMIDCACLKCKMTRTFPKDIISEKSNFIPVDFGIILPLSIALSDYKFLKEKEKSDEIICKTMKRRYSSMY